MTEFIKTWLMGITGAAILAALADSLMPNGPVKQVGRLVCGMVLLVAILRPVMQVNLSDLSDSIGQFNQHVEAEAADLETQRQSQLKVVIDERYSAYIVDKARELGLTCRVEFTSVLSEGGVFLPGTIQLYGVFTTQQQQALATVLQTDLGISPQDIYFIEEGGHETNTAAG